MIKLMYFHDVYYIGELINYREEDFFSFSFFLFLAKRCIIDRGCGSRVYCSGEIKEIGYRSEGKSSMRDEQ